jgi:hypothetical protein
LVQLISAIDPATGAALLTDLCAPMHMTQQNLSQQGILSMPIVSKHPFLFAQGFVDLADLARFIARNFADRHWSDYEEFSTYWQQPSINSWRTATVRDLPLKFSVQPLLEGFSFFHAVETMARCAYVPQRQTLIYKFLFHHYNIIIFIFCLVLFRFCDAQVLAALAPNECALSTTPARSARSSHNPRH